MSLFRYNRVLLSHLLISKQPIPYQPSSIIIRHATEIRSRKIVNTNSNSKQRKNTVNPIAQVKKLGDKAGMMDLNKFLLINYKWTIHVFSQSTLQRKFGSNIQSF